MVNYLLEVIGLSKSFKNKHIFNDVNMKIKNGEVVGLVGPNGSGKSTFMKCITGLIRPTTGQIILNKFDLINNRESALMNISAQIEAPGLYSELTGYENLLFFKRLRGIDNIIFQEVIELIDLDRDLHFKTKYYSMGMKQRISVGIALLTNSKLIVLDEPFNGLDISGMNRFLIYINEKVIKKKMSFLISSHQLYELALIADRFFWLKDGKLVEYDSSNFIQFEIEIENTADFDVNILKKYGAKKLENSIYVNLENIEELNKVLTVLIEQNLNILTVKKIENRLLTDYIKSAI